MDALSEVFRAVRLNGAVYLDAELRAPWCVVGRADEGLCSAFLPTSKRVISYHLVVEGGFRAQLPGDDASAVELTAGEILVIPQGETHIMGSAAGMRPYSFAEIAGEKLRAVTGEVMHLEYGGAGAKTRLLCGFLGCDDVLANPLIASLPRIFKVDVSQGPASAWIAASLRFAAQETGAPRAGGEMMLAKLSELVFVEAVRRYVDTLPENEKSWLAGLRDRFVGRALGLMHAQPDRPWTVDELAHEVGLSRSAFAEKFSSYMEQPPMQYLAQWRLLVAAQRLRDGDEHVTDVAAAAGYESEAAFNRAFKRAFGLPPASWRRSQRKSSGSTFRSTR